MLKYTPNAKICMPNARYMRKYAKLYALYMRFIYTLPVPYNAHY